MSDMRIMVGITGASGAAYAVRLCRGIVEAGGTLIVTVTEAGKYVLAREAGIDIADAERAPQVLCEAFSAVSGKLIYHDIHDITAPVASGSAAADAMAVCPCTMGTLARIACGNSANLLERAADVMLKERRPLVVVPRETPLGTIHLQNMLRLARSGATILPAMPAFYHEPSTVDDMVDFVAGKILDALRVENSLFRRWSPGENS